MCYLHRCLSTKAAADLAAIKHTTTRVEVVNPPTSSIIQRIKVK